MKTPNSSDGRKRLKGPPRAALDEFALHEQRGPDASVMSYVDGDRIYRRVVRFLACCEKDSAPDALRVWRKVLGMTDAGSDDEAEAAEFIDALQDAIADVNPEADPTFKLTRDKLRQKDLDVAQAARALIVALDNHPSDDFQWRRCSMPLAKPMIWSQTFPPKLQVFQEPRLVLPSPPSPRQVALRVEKRAQLLAEIRLKEKKSRQNESKETLLRRGFERRLIERLHARFSSATANRIAGVVSPIVELLFDAPESFDRCRNLARDVIKASTNRGG